MNRLLSQLVLAAIAVLSLLAYGWQQRELGATRVQGARWKAELDSLAAVSRQVDTVYQVQRVTFTLERERLDTLTVTVDRWKHDTIRVVEYVARADSTVRACSALVITCEERVNLRDLQLAAWERRWEAREKPRAALWVWLERGAIAYVSFKVGQTTDQ